MQAECGNLQGCAKSLPEWRECTAKLRVKVKPVRYLRIKCGALLKVNGPLRTKTCTNASPPPYKTPTRRSAVEDCEYVEIPSLQLDKRSSSFVSQLITLPKQTVTVVIVTI